MLQQYANTINMTFPDSRQYRTYAMFIGDLHCHFTQVYNKFEKQKRKIETIDQISI